MAKFDLNKTKGLSNVMNAVQQVKSVSNVLPLNESKELLIENIYPSGENFYSVEALDELSESIQELGILQPLLVSDSGNGAYEIIAGNRRYEAAKMAGIERLPCIVKQNVDPVLFKIMLIHANMFRVKTDMERAMEVAELKKAILALKSSDKSIKGRTNEIAGQILNLSYRQISRLDNLNKLIPEIQNLVQSGRLTPSGAEPFASLEDFVQREIYETLISTGMDINREEASRLSAEFQAKNLETETRGEAGLATLRDQLLQEQARLREKEQELESLTDRIREQEQDGAPSAPQNHKELGKVKQALVSALRDRKDMEDRYNELSRMWEDRYGGTTVAGRPSSVSDAEKLINDVKRKVHLQECIGQLKLAARTYAAYKKLNRPAVPAKPSADETDLLDELVKNVRELSRLISAE